MNTFTVFYNMHVCQYTVFLHRYNADTRQNWNETVITRNCVLLCMSESTRLLDRIGAIVLYMHRLLCSSPPEHARLPSRSARVSDL